LRNAGPARLATELRLAGFDTICVDIGALNINYVSTLDKIIEKFVGKDTLWVGISTTFLTNIFGIKISREGLPESNTSDDKFLLHFLDKCKQRNPNVKFILGGSYFVNLDKYGFYHFKGYADYELIEFTQWCKDQSYKMNIDRLGKVINCKEFSSFVTSQIKWHASDLIMPNETLPIEISRGCIFKCKFCAFPLNGKYKGEWIKRTEVLRNELIYNYETYGTTRYIFADDTYNDSLDKITDLYENVFSKLPFKLNFTSYLRLDLMNRFPDSVEILQKSGLRSAMFGIETNNVESAKTIGKGLEFEKQIEFIKKIKTNEFKDVLTHSAFILGLPKDTRASMESLKQFLLSNNNPLDEWVCRPLSLNPVNYSQHKKYFSEFDLNFEKYGYKIINDEKDSNIYRMQWSLDDKDFDYNYCLNFSNEINEKSENLPNMKFGAQLYARYSTILPEQEVFSTSRLKLKEKYDLPSLVRNYLKNYYTKILSY
jgi:hypothetical protein